MFVMRAYNVLICESLGSQKLYKNTINAFVGMPWDCFTRFAELCMFLH
jgi:hypothetical protein